MNPTQIIEELDRLRAVQGLSITELARRAGLARPGVSRAIHGRKQPCLATVCKLARALGATVTLTES